ncbi:MAG: REP-associated tyrosine transposase [Anaerolineae bacterium]
MTTHRGWYSRGYLPHRDEPGLIQALTSDLADSLPLGLLQEGDPSAESDGARRVRIQALLDQGWGGCLLADERVAEIVENTLLYFDGTRYALLAWVIMPNHVHVVVETLDATPLARMLQNWKGYSARRANEVLNRKGTLWHREYYDRYIRDVRHLENAVLYVHNNPVKAGLVESPADWRFGSARRVGGVDRMWHVPFEGQSRE